jgi:hypothetical protein
MTGSEPRRLSELDEARGLLQEVSCRDGLTMAAFAWGSVALPEELEHYLRSMVGHEIAILRIDGKYHCRAA